MSRHKKVPKFLQSCDSAWSWAVKHIDTAEEMEEGAHRGGYHAAVREQAREWACEYSRFAAEAYRAGRITVYRVVRVGSLDEIRLDRIGKAWSFLKEGAGVYGMAPDSEGMLDVLIEGEVKPLDVDWEYGFQSFIYYGPGQSEVSLMNYSPVLVTALDDEPLKKPAMANTGDSSEVWRA